jgi:hypothetical protein
MQSKKKRKLRPKIILGGTMTKQIEKEYGYKRFTPEQYEFAQDTGLKKGDFLPDIELVDLSGRRVKLQELSRGKPLVIETGSMTCPMYAQSSPSMQEIIKKYPQFSYVLIYVREAHPGERQRQHNSIEEKVAAAMKAAIIYKEFNRTILIDDVYGSAHNFFGSMPNSIYVLSTYRHVMFKSAWNNTNEIEKVLQELVIKGNAESRELKAVPPFSFRGTRALFLGGFIALWDFVIGLPRLISNHKKVGNI